MSVDPRPVLAPAPSIAAGRSPGALIVAWQHPDVRLISPVGRLDHGPGTEYRFRYLRSAPEVAGFHPFLNFPDWERDYRSERLFPLFSQRVMSPRRADFAEFLRQLHLDSDATPWEQLARSEGRRTGDTVQVFPMPTVDDAGLSRCTFLVHGIRHVTGGALPPLTAGEVLWTRPEPGNPRNPRAQLVRTGDGLDLGYVPDMLLEHVEALQRTADPSLVVEHVNGPEAPSHLRLLVRLEGRTPTGYRPMSGPRWATFPESARPAS
ncbi:hypothetical protein [Pseudonocardia alni]|uniref:hypothetical protein n=1 Tax=Pseudonocardia alni TaxID=33907 RepID=UPI00280BD85C|nr:hypothetical protein [Pseudonocardia alni]